MTPPPSIEQQAREIAERMIGHTDCEDTWYSCPLAPGGSSNVHYEGTPDKCRCGADTVRSDLTAAIVRLVERAVAEEREACALVADSFSVAPYFDDSPQGGWCADEIPGGIASAVRARAAGGPQP